MMGTLFMSALLTVCLLPFIAIGFGGEARAVTTDGTVAMLTYAGRFGQVGDVVVSMLLRINRNAEGHEDNGD